MLECIAATLVQGYQIASGRSAEDLRFPQGTIRLQTPFFKEKGLDFDLYFNGDYVSGTLNLSLGGKTVQVLQPEYYFTDIKWSDCFPAENFYLSKAAILFQGRKFLALIYIPDPKTKVDHFSSPSIVEVIAQTIVGIHYGDKLTLCYNAKEIFIA